MRLGTLELKAIDQLLDEALELGPQDYARWLDGLGHQFAHVAPVLRDLLACRATEATGNLLDRPPAVAEAFSNLIARSMANELNAGDTIGPYRLLRELGVGGMGVVWLAQRTDGLIERPVALKLPLFSVHHRALAERFNRERAILARLAHPDIARLYDAGIASSGQPYLALEYVEGEPLTDWCDARRSDLRERIALVVKVLRAVQYAHANLVIHRDLKPSNILVTKDGEVRLLDFGIAKLVSDDGEGETELTRLAGRLLTPSYAAPEHFSGAPISIASDVYSVGVILYQLLTGARPYRPRDESRGALEAAILHDEPSRPSLAVSDETAARRGVVGGQKLARLLTGDLDTIVLKALKKRPEGRYATASALAEDLERHLRGEAIYARADNTLYRAAKVVARHRIAFAATGAIVIALITGATIALWQAREARREAARASAVQEFVVDLFQVNSADQADPMRARQTTARELLDRGRARVAQSLRDQPQPRLQMLETLANLYSELGLWGEASELTGQRIDLTRSLYGADDLRVAAAISDQVRFDAVREGPLAESIDAHIREALRIHDANGDLESVARALLHERASRFYVNNGRLPVAAEHAERAIAIYRTHYATHKGFPEALAALANTQLRRGDPSAALATYEEALSVARKLRLPDSRLVFFLFRAGETSYFVDRFGDADSELREALTMSDRINGPKHTTTVAIRCALARNLAAMARMDEAVEVATRAVADVLSGASRETSLRDAHRQMFEVYMAHGDLVTARDGNSAALSTFGSSVPDTFTGADLLLERAVVETVYGRTADALATLEQADAIANRLGFPRKSLLGGNLALHKGEARLARGDAADARALFEEQRTYWRAGKGGSAGLRVELNVGLVDALLALGAGAEARGMARETEAELAREPGRRYLIEAQAQIERALARVAIAEQDFAAALPHAERSAELYRGIHLPESPFRAEAEALRSLCLAKLGRLEEARLALAAGRAAQLKHGTLAERFVAPLREAQRALAGAPAASPR